MEDYASDMDGDYHDRNFELTKDLVRLHTSPSIQQTLTTLKRLADFHWNVGDYGADSPEHFMALVRDHVTDAHSIQELQKRRNTTRYFNGALKEHAVDDLLLARAKDGEAEFQYHLGRRLAQTDPQSAITWLQRASDQDFVAADFELGNVYYQIAHTVKDEENLRLRQLAYKAHVRAASKGAELAEQGDAWAALILARMHSDRSAGLDWDQQKIDRYLCLGNKNRPRGYPERYIGLICK